MTERFRADVGSRLGPYHLLDLLGKGGMGEVYRAHDTRLDRQVALKVIRNGDQDPERIQRFAAEARATAALNHPNIMAVYDVGDHDGVAYFVAELLRGSTLRSKLHDGPLKPAAAIELALQICSGIAAAHAAGIVHRDLKPENIFLTTDGHAKILDFGLAKVNAPTHDDRTATLASGTGILGTIAYMAPEQLRGATVDQRSDLFALGAILLEMLTGNKPFTGDSTAEVIGAILRDEPSYNNVSEPLATILRHCLEKDPERRYQSARDLAFDLKTFALTAAPSTETPRPASWWRLAAVGLALALLGGLIGYIVRSPESNQAATSVSARTVRATDFVGLEQFPVISPDGRSIAFIADVSGARQIWIRLVAGGPPLQLTHDQADHEFPRWTPDSAALIYYTPPTDETANGTVWEISALGGVPRRITTSIGGADVSHDGKQIAVIQGAEDKVRLVTVTRDGTPIKTLTELPAGDYHLYPQWSPDDRWIAFQQGSTFDWEVFAVPAEGGRPLPVTRDPYLLSGFAWLPDSSGVVFSSARDSTVLYLPVFNLWKIKLDGTQLQQLTFGEASYIHPSVDSKGTIASTLQRTGFDIWRFPVSGDARGNTKNAVQITRQTGIVQTPTLDPSGEQMAYLADSGGHGNIWIMRLVDGQSRQITFESDPRVNVGVPVWSPDGKRISFVSTKNLGRGQVGIWVVDPDGGNNRPLVESGGWACWSGDGRWVYYGGGRNAAQGLKKISVADGGEQLVRSDNATRPAISADGRTLYYTVELQAVNGASSYEIRAATPEGGPSRLLARLSAARVPQWQLIHPVLSPDGKWLAMPLYDQFATNIWLISTQDGHLVQVTDFAPQRTFIARRVTWSPDGKSIYAALGVGGSDVVLTYGLPL